MRKLIDGRSLPPEPPRPSAARGPCEDRAGATQTGRLRPRAKILRTAGYAAQDTGGWEISRGTYAAAGPSLTQGMLYYSTGGYMGAARALASSYRQQELTKPPGGSSPTSTRQGPVLAAALGSK